MARGNGVDRSGPQETAHEPVAIVGICSRMHCRIHLSNQEVADLLEYVADLLDYLETAPGGREEAR
jgi:hypothetical protein